MKKIGTFLTVLCMCLLFVGTDVHLQAATGKTSVAVSAGTVNIGDTVKITAMAAGPSGEKTVATMTISYDASVFSFVDCSTTYGGGGGSVTATSDRFTVTLKAVGAGSSKIALAASDGVVFNTNEELDSMEGSSTTIKVNNAASENTTNTNTNADNTANGSEEKNTTDNAKLSADNSLKALSISPGTLSPAFTGKTVQYTATVANDVTRVAVTATPANEKATVESVTGNENLSVGNNAVKIVVKAENGVTATYTITVTRQEAAASSEKSEEPQVLTEEPVEQKEPVETTGETVTIGEISYGISESFSSEMIPAGFSEATVNYHGTDYKGVNFGNGNLSMLYLVPGQTSDTETAEFFIYDAAGDGFYPFIQLKHGDNFIIWLPNPAEYAATEGEQQVDIAVNDGKTMRVNQLGGAETSDFSFFYAVNQDGTTGWYQYDALEQTYQRKKTDDTGAEAEKQETEDADSNLAYLQEEYSTLENEMKKEKSFSRTTIGVLIFIIAVLIIIIINLILQRRGDNEDFDDYDEYEEKPKTQQKKRTENSRHSSDAFGDAPETKKTKTSKRFLDDFEDDFEEEEEIKMEKKQRVKRLEKEEPEDNYEETKKHETAAKSKDGIEVIDFNDL